MMYKGTIFYLFFSLHLRSFSEEISLSHSVGYKNHSVGYIFHSVEYKSRSVEQRIFKDDTS